ncbi:hypothetical protein BABINDRAFT_159553 [Babjeviella inositovora NRRL Y-12698]|uniref:Checkpoint protein n=1 Tax=Babjeviella inositovora NRRL Y-12698 TaxID=984486 RepID=A0A1E3R133_9ASCO|nr:uncharacterized protein BABINDRAFT_159553 [Babjeviella inositovora NRRL Y-12698]ODQ83097.1 hypothetical protein BABINDRAFT_159553 [Babjeviella inositovora NRRL Y-12698]
MKLKITTGSTETLKHTLGAIIAIRKFCVFRFTPDTLTIISASLSEPQIWSTIAATAFLTYEVESVRDNIVSVELNIEPLLQVLRSFHKTASSDQLNIRLQRKNAVHGQRSASLALFYTEQNASGHLITNTFRIPVRVLNKESDERILEPLLTKVDVLIKLPLGITSLFKRIERYKRTDKVTVTGTRNGYLGLTIKEDGLKVTMSWNALLDVSEDERGSQSQSQHEVGPDEPLSVDVKLKDWRLGAKMCDFCSKVVLIISRGEALVIHCYSDDDQSEIIYFLSSVSG